MEVKYLVKNLDEVCPFSFILKGNSVSTWTSPNLIESLRGPATHANLEECGFTMCIPGEFL